MIPKQLPIMSLPGMVFFPNVSVPLYLFEERYQAMLDDTLDSDRLFVLACKDPLRKSFPNSEDSPCSVATAGIMRSCKRNPDGTANLMLQGLARVAITNITTEEPYPIVDIETFETQPGADDEELDHQRSATEKLILENLQAYQIATDQIMETLKQLQGPEVFLDCAVSVVCQDVFVKQQLLEELEVYQRFKTFNEYLKKENDLMSE